MSQQTNGDYSNGNEDYINNEAPTHFRPPSFSIITLVPETSKLFFQQLQQKRSYKQDDMDFKAREDENQSDHLSSHCFENYQLKMKYKVDQHQRKSSSSSGLPRKYSDADLKLRSIVYGQNYPDLVDEKEDYDEDELVKLTINDDEEPIEDCSTSHQEMLIQPTHLILKQNNDKVKHLLENMEQLVRTENSHQNQKGKLDSASTITSIEPQSRILKSILKPPISLSILSGNQNLSFSPSSNIDSDMASIGECSIGHNNDQIQTQNKEQERNDKINRTLDSRMVKLLSIMYALLVVIVGAIITIGDMDKATNDYDHLYNIFITFIGLIFLAFIHIDVQRHKRYVLKWQQSCKEIIESPLLKSSPVNGIFNKEYDSISVTTAIIFNRVYQMNLGDQSNELDDITRKSLNGYRFLTGKHSGSFYLKIGMILFCMGSIIHQGLNLSFQIHYFFTGAKECQNYISLIVYFLHCISAFYQLYIAFKYSNLIINRNQLMVRFGLMHMVGSSLSFWFSTIIEEAIYGYFKKFNNINESKRNEKQINHVLLENSYHYYTKCLNKTLTDLESIDALPYFYPFSIEFNIILASVWYMIWSNVGNDNPTHSEMHPIREELNKDQQTGQIDIVYRSNIIISADCHASNLGMFSGLFSLLVTIITIIVFFTTIKHNQYKTIGIAVYTIQLTFLTMCCALAVPLAFRKTRKLNVSKHLDSPQYTMDDFLLMIPLPFYYTHHILCIYSEILKFSVNSVIMAFCYVVNLVQVTWQTPFIIDGIRRCSNDCKLRYTKPGKQLITFSIIINVTLWILMTFEIKMVDKYHSMPLKYGKFIWMIILDTCLPLMLFYRFHSSVCLSDMWKNCYEKDEH